MRSPGIVSGGGLLDEKTPMVKTKFLDKGVEAVVNE